VVLTLARYRRRPSASASYFDVLCSGNRREQKHLFVGSRAEHLAPVQVQALAHAPLSRFLGSLLVFLGRECERQTTQPVGLTR
jgi:hypothetical protein